MLVSFISFVAFVSGNDEDRYTGEVRHDYRQAFPLRLQDPVYSASARITQIKSDLPSKPMPGNSGITM